MISVVAKLRVRKPPKYSQVKCTFIVLKRHFSEEGDSKTYELFQLEEGPQKEISLTTKDAIFYYTQMQRIRKMENSCTQLYMEKGIRGFLHLYSGEEACCVGIKAIMQPGDTSITSYRCHGWAVAMGETVHAVIAELLGKVTG